MYNQSPLCFKTARNVWAHRFCRRTESRQGGEGSQTAVGGHSGRCGTPSQPPRDCKWAARCMEPARMVWQRCFQGESAGNWVRRGISGGPERWRDGQIHREPCEQTIAFLLRDISGFVLSCNATRVKCTLRLISFHIESLWAYRRCLKRGTSGMIAGDWMGSISPESLFTSGTQYCTPISQSCHAANYT